MGGCRLNACDAKCEPVKAQFDMVRHPSFRNAEGLHETEPFVKRLQAGQITGIEIDHRGLKGRHHRHSLGSLRQRN